MMMVCKTCGETKPEDDYYPMTTSRGGRRLSCKVCHIKATKERAEKEAAAIGPFLPPEPAYVALYHILYTEEPWKQDAACGNASMEADTYRDYFDGNYIGRTKEAQCARCPVAFECLEYSDRINATDGLWGGLSGDGRREFLNSVDLRSPKAKLLHAAVIDKLRERQKVG